MQRGARISAPPRSQRLYNYRQRHDCQIQLLFQAATAMVSDDAHIDSALELVLEDLLTASALEGLAILDTATPDSHLRMLHSVGVAGPETMDHGRALLRAHPGGPAFQVAADRRPLLACPWMLPPDRFGGALLWRAPGARPWRREDYGLAAGLGVMLRAIVAASVGQIGIDRLTGLPNRRWFIDEVDRHLERLDHDGKIGTLSVVEVNGLPSVSAIVGRDTGNAILTRLAIQLRTSVRPGDAVARIGPARFAVWQPAMDHMTAAERADALCAIRLSPDLPPGAEVALAIGIVSRQPTGGEDTRALLRRAQTAVEQVRQNGGGGWRVSHAAPLLP
jgi:diguanylate cyclase (GGDEF)-like protein